jgi:hypothetical protein
VNTAVNHKFRQGGEISCLAQQSSASEVLCCMEFVIFEFRNIYIMTLLNMDEIRNLMLESKLFSNVSVFWRPPNCKKLMRWKFFLTWDNYTLLFSWKINLSLRAVIVRRLSPELKKKKKLDRTGNIRNIKSYTVLLLQIWELQRVTVAQPTLPFPCSTRILSWAAAVIILVSLLP